MGELVQLKGLRDRSETGEIEETRTLPPDQNPLTTDHYPLSTNHYPLSPYWRSLEELANSEEFDEWLHREFPNNASEWTSDVGRRTFLKLMGASLALGGLTACTRQPA